MGKFSRDLDPSLEEKVKQMVLNLRLKDAGINVETFKYSKKNFKDAGMIVKNNDLAEAMTSDPDLVGICLNEELLLQLDDQSQDVIIEGLLSQISYDDEKDKVVVTKPEISVSLGMYRKYKDIAIQKQELVQLTLAQMKEAEKELKKGKKKKKGED